MRFLAYSKLFELSEHRYKTPEGYLICIDSILSKTGKQEYMRDDIFKDGSTVMVQVNRTEDEVFSEKALASFENKPLTIEHPNENVNPENHSKYAVGFVRDVKRGKDGTEDVMLGTIVITDAEIIELVESGKFKELSCGYACDIDDSENLCQKNIRGNHVALCKHGRAENARIVDSIYDMSLSIADAMDLCISLGKKFIERFDKIYNAPMSTSIQRWVNEMCGWYSSVKQIVLKNTNKPLLNGELRDWFFTAGANPEMFMKNPINEELEAYDQFTDQVLNGISIKNSLCTIKYSVVDADEILVMTLEKIANKYNFAKTAQANARTTKSDLRYINKKYEFATDLKSKMKNEWLKIVETLNETYRLILGKNPSIKQVNELKKFLKMR